MRIDSIVTQQNFDNFIARPRVQIFLSVDIVDSTKKKQKLRSGTSVDVGPYVGHEEDGSWLAQVVGFYLNFQKYLNANLEKSFGRRIDVRPFADFWKALGDEAIFTLEINSCFEAKKIIKAFCDTIVTWNIDAGLSRGIEKGKERQGRDSVKLKGSCWVAGFPVTNTAILLGEMKDYIGPSMDLGFRISKFSTAKRVALTADLAWLLLKSPKPIPICYDGRSSLKGISEEFGYPNLSIDISSSEFLKLERHLFNRKEVSETQKLRNLCASFIGEFGVPAFPPFFPKNGVPIAFRKALAVERDFLATLYEVDSEEETKPAQMKHQWSGAQIEKYNQFLHKKAKFGNKKKG